MAAAVKIKIATVKAIAVQEAESETEAVLVKTKTIESGLEQEIESDIKTDAIKEAGAPEPEPESVDRTGTEQTASEPEQACENLIPETSNCEAGKGIEVEAVEQETDGADEILEQATAERVETTTDTPESAENEVSQGVDAQPVAPSPANQPREQWPAGSALCAEDVMHKELIWESPDDSVQEILTKMERHDVHYVLIGQNGVLEGLVSETDLAAALSPFLRPEFAHLRQPEDDATLQIRVKWIMSRPVYTVNLRASLLDTISVMSRVGKLCLPVVDEQEKVHGLVTESDIFKVMLKPRANLN